MVINNQNVLEPHRAELNQDQMQHSYQQLVVMFLHRQSRYDTLNAIYKSVS